MIDKKTFLLDSLIAKTGQGQQESLGKPARAQDYSTISKFSEEEEEIKQNIISSLSSIGISVKEVGSNKGQNRSCSTLIEARKILSDSKNQFSNEVLTSELGNEIVNETSFKDFSETIGGLVTNHVYYSAGGALGALSTPEEKENQILNSISAKIEYIAGFEAEGESMVPIWKELDDDLPDGQDSLFCRIRQDSSLGKLSSANSLLNGYVADEYFSLSRSSVRVSNGIVDPNLTQGIGKVETPLLSSIIDRTTKEMKLLDNSDKEMGSDVKIQKQIVEAFKSAGYGDSLENDRVATIFSNSLTILQPQVVISFGADFGSLSFKNPKVMTIPIPRTEIAKQNISNRTQAGIVSANRLATPTIAGLSMAEKSSGPSFTVAKSATPVFVPMMENTKNPLLSDEQENEVQKTLANVSVPEKSIASRVKMTPVPMAINRTSGRY